MATENTEKSLQDQILKLITENLPAQTAQAMSTYLRAAELAQSELKVIKEPALRTPALVPTPRFFLGM